MVSPQKRKRQKDEKKGGNPISYLWSTYPGKLQKECFFLIIAIYDLPVFARPPKNPGRS